MSAFERDPTAKVAAKSKLLRLPTVELVVVSGPDRGKKAPIAKGRGRIGSGAGCDFVLADPTVSRVHCELRVEQEGVWLRDAGSTNGTFAEGVRIVEGTVRAGALLTLGTTVVRVDVQDDPSFVELSTADHFGELLGASVAMRSVYSTLERVAPTDATVLVLGETGTGKEVVARALHAASPRAQRSFVAVDCGAIPENLFESELFGHVRGAFTGALTDRRGVFEEAAGGTLFLDEIGEVPLALQAKLLRALEARTIRPIGATTERPIDVRIVAATNRSLGAAVNDGSFREDLYYRLAVVEVALPPLRARREDVATLARHFHARLGGRGELTPDFLAMLERRSWPGNVRELRNFIERSVALGFVTSQASTPPPPLGGSAPSLEDLALADRPLKEARQAWMASFDAVYLRALLKRTGGNVTHAAAVAGVNRRFLQRMAARLGLRAADLGDEDD
jgi:DNA-binding NtrC family response regulator